MKQKNIVKLLQACFIGGGLGLLLTGCATHGVNNLPSGALVMAPAGVSADQGGASGGSQGGSGSSAATQGGAGSGAQGNKPAPASPFDAPATISKSPSLVAPTNLNFSVQCPDNGCASGMSVTPYNNDINTNLQNQATALDTDNANAKAKDPKAKAVSTLNAVYLVADGGGQELNILKPTNAKTVNNTNVYIKSALVNAKSLTVDGKSANVFLLGANVDAPVTIQQDGNLSASGEMLKDVTNNGQLTVLGPVYAWDNATGQPLFHKPVKSLSDSTQSLQDSTLEANADNGSGADNGSADNGNAAGASSQAAPKKPALEVQNQPLQAPTHFLPVGDTPSVGVWGVTLTVDGNYTQAPDATLDLQSHATVKVLGKAKLDGTVLVASDLENPKVVAGTATVGVMSTQPIEGNFKKLRGTIPETDDPNFAPFGYVFSYGHLTNFHNPVVSFTLGKQTYYATTYYSKGEPFSTVSFDDFAQLAKEIPAATCEVCDGKHTGVTLSQTTDTAGVQSSLPKASAPLNGKTALPNVVYTEMVKGSSDITYTVDNKAYADKNAKISLIAFSKGFESTGNLTIQDGASVFAYGVPFKAKQLLVERVSKDKDIKAPKLYLSGSFDGNLVNAGGYIFTSNYGTNSITNIVNLDAGNMDQVTYAIEIQGLYAVTYPTSLLVNGDFTQASGITNVSQGLLVVNGKLQALGGAFFHSYVPLVQNPLYTMIAVANQPIVFKAGVVAVNPFTQNLQEFKPHVLKLPVADNKFLYGVFILLPPMTGGNSPAAATQEVRRPHNNLQAFEKLTPQSVTVRAFTANGKAMDVQLAKPSALITLRDQLMSAGDAQQTVEGTELTAALSNQARIRLLLGNEGLSGVVDSSAPYGLSLNAQAQLWVGHAQRLSDIEQIQGVLRGHNYVSQLTFNHVGSRFNASYDNGASGNQDVKSDRLSTSQSFGFAANAHNQLDFVYPGFGLGYELSYEYTHQNIVLNKNWAPADKVARLKTHTNSVQAGVYATQAFQLNPALRVMPFAGYRLAYDALAGAKAENVLNNLSFTLPDKHVLSNNLVLGAKVRYQNAGLQGLNLSASYLLNLRLNAPKLSQYQVADQNLAVNFQFEDNAAVLQQLKLDAQYQFNARLSAGAQVQFLYQGGFDATFGAQLSYQF